MAVEAAIDMVNHLISKNGYRIPEDYAEAFRASPRGYSPASLAAVGSDSAVSQPSGVFVLGGRHRAAA